MDSFLPSDSTDEREKWNIFDLVAVEIFLLELEFRLLMSSRGFGSEDAQSFLFSDAIGERKRMRVSPQYRGKIRFLKQLYFVRIRHCSPVITSLKCTFGRIYDQFVVDMLDIEFRVELSQPLKTTLFFFGVDSTLVEWVKVMANMHEFGTVENLLESA